MNPALLYLALGVPIALFCVAMAVRHFAKTFGPDGWRRRFVAARESGRLFVVMAIVVPGCYLLAVGVFLSWFGGSTYIRVLGALPMACMFAAMQTMGLSRRPTGERMRCSKCKYDLAGLEAGEVKNSPPSGGVPVHDGRCPECGGRWGWPGGSVKVDKRWSVGWIAVTVVLLLPLAAQFGSIPMMGILWWNRSLLKLAPTSSLVEEALTSKSFTMDAWAELAGRVESPAQTDRIARHLLVRREKGWQTGTFFSTDEAAWLSKTLAAGAIAPELVEPWLKNVFTITVRGGSSSDEAIARIKPVARAFAPFEHYGTVSSPFMACAIVASSDVGYVTHEAAITIPTGGIALFRSYSLGPLALPEGGYEKRFRGTVTVCLQVPGSARPVVDASGRVAAAGGCLYQTVIPMDVPIEDQK